MSGYGVFARYYDILTSDIDYKARAAYFDSIIKRCCPDAKLVLDLACGTGSLTYALAGLGYDMIGADASEEMLSVAMSKNSGGNHPLFLRQNAEALDLFGTVDACICALDSLNHLPGEAAFQKAVERVALFLNPGGVFIFDMNTPYKHRNILADNTFVYEHDGLMCVWRNRLHSGSGRVDIVLDFFERRKNGAYLRETESFSEYCYDTDTVCGFLGNAGLEVSGIYRGDTFMTPEEDTQRIVYAAIKKE